MARVEQVAAGEGLEYHLADGVSGNTLLAHELLHLAAEHGLRNELKERLLHAYFEEGRSVFDVDSLVPFAVEVGLDEAEVREALADRRYLAAVREDGATAQALGATGVPFFVVDRKYGAAGAQPAELLLQILERAWAEAHPLVTVPGRRRLRRRQLRRLSSSVRRSPSRGRCARERLLGVGVQLPDDVGGRALAASPGRPTPRVERRLVRGRRCAGPRPPGGGRPGSRAQLVLAAVPLPAEVVDQRAAGPALGPGEPSRDVERAGQHGLVARRPRAPAPGRRGS